MRLRLRSTIEVFEADDGDLYVSRGASRAEHVIRQASDRERAIFEALRDEPLDAGGLSARLAQQGIALGAGEASEALEQLLGLHLVESPDLAAPSGLTPMQLERYDRQLAYFADLHGQLGAYDRQHRLAASRVLVLGCGGLGSWTATGLACSGIGSLVLTDPDTVELSNLNRQILFRLQDVGRPKVDAARDALRAFAPELDVEAVRREVRGPGDVLDLVRDVDAVVATADRPPHLISRWVDAACQQLGVPWISAGQFPPTIRVGPLTVPGRTACLECLERAARRTHPHYDALAAARQARPATAATTGPASGLIGCLLANEVVSHLCDLHEPATEGHAVSIDLLTLTVERQPVVRDPDCPRCGPRGIGSAVVSAA